MELHIEKLAYGGDGLARLPADERGPGKMVFLPFVIPGEQVSATLAESRSGFARARLTKVLTPSSHRVVPQCPYFLRCGGCQYQHIDYPAQIRFKLDILRETLRRTAKLELDLDIQLHPSSPWNYRNRTRLQIGHVPAFSLGYFRTGSHQLLPVESCPISSPLINQGIVAAWQLGRQGLVPAAVRDVQFFANHDDSTMLVEISVQPQIGESDCRPFAAALTSTLNPVRGVSVFATSRAYDESRPQTWVRNQLSIAGGAGHLTYRALGHDYRVSAGSFFQTNRLLVDELGSIATASATGRVALDLYAGVGLFTPSLAGKFETVVAVEASPYAFADLKHNAASNVRTIRATIEAFLDKQAARLKPDFVLADPPRAGLGNRAAAALCRTSASQVTYVSCDPATLSRDLRLLLESGFRVQRAHLFDLFPQTAHMETVLHLER